MRGRLHDLTLRARQLLTEETRDLLEGIYGLHQNGSLEEPATLPTIQSLEEARETRAYLEQLLADERDAGLKTAEAVEKLVRETAFTWLNRLAALKMLEARGLVRQSLLKGSDSNGFKVWLTTHGNEAELRRYEAGSLPLDAVGEGPRDTAYRHYLLHLCTDMAAQIRILFDPDTVPSRLCPRPRALTDLLAMLNHPDLAAVWSEDETIGWIYQFFNEEEKNAIFQGFSKGQKIRPSEIPAATQLFTPRWIVRTLVENSLGRLWLQMHSDSRLAEQLEYLVPIQDAPREPLRQVREITLLDPACGTMHFGLVAFDLLAEMYREELECAGSPGWPHEPSVSNAAEIPAAILEHNLFGIDIDLRAVQLSALTFYLKAKALNPQAVIRQSNLACADIHLLDGKHLLNFLGMMRFTRSIFERVIRPLWERLKDSGQMGSLLRVEQDIAVSIEAERRRIPGQARLPLYDAQSLFEEEMSEGDYQKLLMSQIVEAFHEFARHQAEQGYNETYFVGEATKGVRLLDIMLRRYNVVAANPPYMFNRNMSPVMNEYLKRHYPTSKRDLYAAFIDRCTELLAPGGRAALITQQSFMFISSYEGLRAGLMEKTAIEAMIHVGPHAFAEIGGEKVNTTLYVLRREPEASRRANNTGVYFRLVREPNAEAKQLGFERAVAVLRAGVAAPAVYPYRQGDFAAIPGAPWVYWITPGLRRLFQTLPKLGEISQPIHGTATYDNFRFVRFWWEVGAKNICFSATKWSDFQGSNKSYVPYIRGGVFRRWYGNQECVLQLTHSGEVFIEWLKKNRDRIRGQDYLFKPGITWNLVSSGTLSIRFLPGGFIFDVAGPSLFPPDIPLVLGIMNSTFAAYALKQTNPTINYPPGDLAKLPIPTTSSVTLCSLVERAMTLSRMGSMEDETTYEFVAPPTWPNGSEEVAVRDRELAEVERQIDEEVFRLYGIGAEDRLAIQAQLTEPTLATADGEENGENEATDEDDVVAPSVNTAPDASSVAGGLTRQALAVRWVSYAIGIVLGRFQPGIEVHSDVGRFLRNKQRHCSRWRFPLGSSCWTPATRMIWSRWSSGRWRCWSARPKLSHS
jgi:N-6 DNA Methylase